MARATQASLILLLLGPPAMSAAEPQEVPVDSQVDKPPATRVSPSLAPDEPSPQPAPLVPPVQPTLPSTVATQPRPESANRPPGSSLPCQVPDFLGSLAAPFFAEEG